MTLSPLEIIILSFIQGLTEFLPVSSSGHLIIAPHIFGWHDQGLLMDVAVHIGTLFSVLVYFRKELQKMTVDTLSYLCGGFRHTSLKSQENKYVALSLTLIYATIPAVVCGFLLKRTGISMRDPWIVGTTSILFGFLLYVTDRLAQPYNLSHMTPKKGILIGFSQALAIIPGASRSGTCITMARMLGFNREAATRFAFLLSIPAIAGAGTLTILDALKEGINLTSLPLLMAISCSFIFGLSAIHFMLKYVSRHGLLPFALYRILLGIILLFFFS